MVWSRQMRGHLVGIAGLVVALAGLGCKRASTADSQPAAVDQTSPTDEASIQRELDVARAHLHAAKTVTARRDAQLHLENGQGQLIELAAAQRHEAIEHEQARPPSHTPPPAALETASGNLEHVDAAQLTLVHGAGQQLQLDTDGMTEVRLDGMPVKLQDLPPGSAVRATFVPGSTPPVARSIDARRTPGPSKSAPR
jgi:hypothetical protein